MSDARIGRAVALMLLATVLWPVLELTGVSLMDRHHALQVVFLRYAFHLLLLLPFVLALRGVRALHTRRPGLQLLRGAAMAGMPACYVLAADFATSRWIWSIFWTMPALALFGAVLLLRERVRGVAWVTVSVGVAGAALLRGASGGSLVGSVLALGMASTFAAYVVLSRILRDEPLSASLFYTAVGAIVPTAAVVWKVWTPMFPGEYLPAVAVGALSIAILAVIDLSLERAPVAALAPLLTLIPIWETVAVLPLHGRVPGTWQLLGMAVIGVGVVGWWWQHPARGAVLSVNSSAPVATARRDVPRVHARTSGDSK